MKQLPVPDAVAQQVHDKRDEYVRRGEMGTSPVGKWPSKPKVVEYAIQLLCWMENHEDDDAVVSIMSRFKYESKVKRPGRPGSIRKMLDEISAMNVMIATSRLRARGIMSPSNMELIEEYNEMKLSGEVADDEVRGKANREASIKMDELRNDPGIQRLDEVTKKLARKDTNKRIDSQ